MIPIIGGTKTPEFNPIMPGSIDFAFDADLQVTLDGSNNVQQWDSYAGVAISLAQGTADRRPGFSATGLGGKSTVVFPGTNFQHLNDTNISGIDSRTARSLLIVFAADSYITSQLITTDANRTDFIELWGDTIYSYAGMAYPVTFAEDTTDPQILIDVFDGSLPSGSRHKLYQNGSLKGTGSGGTSLLALSALEVGASNGGYYPLIGKVSAFIRYGIALNDEWRSYLFGGFGAKYGITVT